MALPTVSLPLYPAWYAPPSMVRFSHTRLPFPHETLFPPGDTFIRTFSLRYTRGLRGCPRCNGEYCFSQRHLFTVTLYELLLPSLILTAACNQLLTTEQASKLLQWQLHLSTTPILHPYHGCFTSKSYCGYEEITS